MHHWVRPQDHLVFKRPTEARDWEGLEWMTSKERDPEAGRKLCHILCWSYSLRSPEKNQAYSKEPLKIPLSTSKWALLYVCQPACDISGSFNISVLFVCGILFIHFSIFFLSMKRLPEDTFLPSRRCWRWKSGSHLQAFPQFSSTRAVTAQILSRGWWAARCFRHYCASSLPHHPSYSRKEAYSP
jgi:hypothetical protein